MSDELANEIYSRAQDLAKQEGRDEVGRPQVTQASAEVRLGWRSAGRSRLIEDVFRLYAGVFTALGALAGVYAVIRISGHILDPLTSALVLMSAVAIAAASVGFAFATIYKVFRERAAQRRAGGISVGTIQDSTVAFLESWVELEDLMRSAAGPQLPSDAPLSSAIEQLANTGQLTRDQVEMARRLLSLRNSIVHEDQLLATDRANQAIDDARSLRQTLEAHVGKQRTLWRPTR
jgi:hypothetical protein